jgi:hypothetical protein
MWSLTAAVRRRRRGGGCGALAALQRAQTISGAVAAAASAGATCALVCLSSPTSGRRRRGDTADVVCSMCSGSLPRAFYSASSAASLSAWASVSAARGRPRAEEAAWRAPTLTGQAGESSSAAAPTAAARILSLAARFPPRADTVLCLTANARLAESDVASAIAPAVRACHLATAAAPWPLGILRPAGPCLPSMSACVYTCLATSSSHSDLNSMH